MSTWNETDRLIWTLAGPSRRLRKLYRALADLDAEMAAVRASNPVPEHAPSSFVAIREQLRPLDDRRFALLDRIAQLQNDDEHWPLPSPTHVRNRRLDDD